MQTHSTRTPRIVPISPASLGHAGEPHEERQRGDQRQLHHNHLQRQGSDSGREADNHSGSVGCAVGTLGDVDNAIRELGLSVDYKDGKIELTYTNCKVVVKIDNTTGKIVEGSWAYDVNVYANGIKVSIVSVNNLKGIVAFSYTAKADI